MEWQAAPIFASPVFKLKINGAAAARDVFRTKLQDGASDDIRDEQGALSHYHSRNNIFEEVPELAKLGEALTKAGNFVYHELMNFKDSGPLHVTNAWINLCELGGVQPMHNHANCLLCGTFYLHADANTKLSFEHPQFAPSAYTELYDKPSDSPNAHGLKFHQRTAQFGVEAGECLFWPSNLRHGYGANQTPGRLSLSFNMMPDKLNVDYKLRPES